MGIKERVEELLNDTRQLSIGEAFYQQDLRISYPEVKLFDLEGNELIEGLLTEFNSDYFVIRYRADHGYISEIEPDIKKFRLVTKDGREMTPKIFMELARGR